MKRDKPNPDCMLIAEVGNCHEGSLSAAIDMLGEAYRAGADLVKFQAGTAEGFARNPADQDQIKKYRKYELGVEGYDALIAEGVRLGVPVFFSVWSPEFEQYYALRWRKIAARQCDYLTVRRWDSKNTFISFPHTMSLKEASDFRRPPLAGIPMHVVAEYPAKNPRFIRMADLRAALKMPLGSIGYSDHTVGIKCAVKAATDKYLRARAIEKHFTLRHNFGPLRDHQLAATPKEFREMTERIRG